MFKLVVVIIYEMLGFLAKLISGLQSTLRVLVADLSVSTGYVLGTASERQLCYVLLRTGNTGIDSGAKSLPYPRKRRGRWVDWILMLMMVSSRQ